MSIKIIGAGLPRTGTNTLKASLEKLGYSKTYHMKELLAHPENLHYWLTLQKTGTTNWDELYDGYQATVDFPAYPWYKEHMQRYPDAKVILTVRPFEKWYTSLYSTIWQAGPQTLGQKLSMISKLMFNSRLRSVIKCVKFAKSSIFEKHLQGKFADKTFAEDVFNKHVEDVKASVPADKLLVYDVRDGWEPLCSFLNVPQPSEPLPHLNKKENFKEMLAEIMSGKMA
jgi:hypothetical protein